MYNLVILLGSRLLFNEQMEAVAIRLIHLICQFDTLYTQILVTSHLDPSNMKCYMLWYFFLVAVSHIASLCEIGSHKNLNDCPCY